MEILKAIIALFVIVDPIGNMPTFLGLTNHLDKEQRNKAYSLSVVVGAGILLFFVLIGNVTLTHVFHIKLADLQIAGGLLLLLLVIRDLMFHSSAIQRNQRRGLSPEEIACVPLGCPLLAGPGAMVISLTIWNDPNSGPTALLIAIAVNFAFFWIVMRYVDKVSRIVGTLVITAFSKVMFIFLAAIGIHLIFAGLTTYGICIP